MRSLVWFRERDLRTEDHGPLAAASEAGEAIPCFVLEAGSRRQVLGDALGDLGRRLEALGSRLLFLEGPAEAALPAWAGRWKVDQILAHSCGDPAAREREARVERALGRVGIPLRLHEGETLVPPGSLRTGNGGLH
ncbi:MAG TPA: deoxyribodipyrimidine photo-lyase, partial [Holophaga sp.]|nr:deoxyribodipyrimidine photo-lyase [Holophaga sp.]